jgi:type VI secretion system protein VasD
MERPVTRDESLVMPRPIESSRRRFWLGTVLASATPLLISGCGMFGSKGPPPREPVTVAGNIQASADLNPSVSQSPRPLTLRIYELKSAVAFEQADFGALYGNDQAALGAEVLVREEIALQPGETRPYDKVLNVETRFVAVFGAYRNPEKSTWRAITPVPAGRKQKLFIRADALAVSVKVTP